MRLVSKNQTMETDVKMLDKKQRFQRLATVMMGQMNLPPLVETMATSYLTSCHQQLSDEKIDEIILNIENCLAYVKGDVDEFPQI